ncbi:SgcJ/EcaC family oxidoreductase [Nocardia sp. 2]|uniref:SgcJ/EcaC family oxidoreductase n=1 Tax=Nocardia acididurans TaxID=2802282 RepID=A0ABS1M5D4_9NOCA|nr:SgcJ/EcaC family oxidoreductase [Nocardia acididurans]MBL1075847.1 SgcJ/EcaC family oxidoreductase [Nocardia acididurans]
MTTAAAATVLEQYEAAFNTNDADAMNALFWDEATFVNFSGSVSTNRADLLAKQRFVFAENGPLHDISVRYDVERTIELAPSFVQVVARQHSRDTSASTPDPMHGVIILTLEQRESEWRIRTGQNTPVSVV